MNKLVTLRKLAAIVLLLCFFLPLSKCSSSSGNGVTSYDYRFPFENITQGVKEIREQGVLNTDLYPLMSVTIIVFLFPAFLLKLSTKLQSIIYIVLAAPAEWLLYHWSSIGQPQIGGILAMSSWTVLFVVGVITLWQELPHNNASKWHGGIQLFTSGSGGKRTSSEPPGIQGKAHMNLFEAIAIVCMAIGLVVGFWCSFDDGAWAAMNVRHFPG